MDIQSIVQQLINGIVSNPDLLSNLAQHPYSTVKEATGLEEISREDASQAVTAATALAQGQSVDFGQLAGIAANLLSQNGDSVHSLANALLGGMNTGADAGQNNAMADILSNLSGVAFSGATANNANSIDLSDGFGLDDLLSLAQKFLGGLGK